VLFPYARHFCGPVEDGDEVWVEAGAVAGVALEESGLDACAETLRAWRGVCACFERDVGGILGVVSPEKVQEGVRFRHCCVVCGGDRDGDRDGDVESWDK
jgi:hypothetical protein